jgi:hypothetical protein
MQEKIHDSVQEKIHDSVQGKIHDGVQEKIHKQPKLRIPGGSKREILRSGRFHPSYRDSKE